MPPVFESRAVRDVSCLPDCFSRPVSDYAIYLNDLMLHKVRNELLMPFVSRLPGTSNSPWIEAKRAEFIVIETARRIVAAEYDEICHKPAVALEMPHGAFCAPGFIGDGESKDRAAVRVRQRNAACWPPVSVSRPSDWLSLRCCG